MIPPLQVKRVLEEALLAAKVDFLYGCYVTDLLTDDRGVPAGVALVNRAGRQAILARTVIDATDRAWLARRAGARFSGYPAGPQEFRRVVVGGEPRQGPGLASRRVLLARPLGVRRPSMDPAASARPFSRSMRPWDGSFELIEYTLRIPMTNGSFAAFAAAEQQARI